MFLLLIPERVEERVRRGHPGGARTPGTTKKAEVLPPVITSGKRRRLQFHQKNIKREKNISQKSVLKESNVLVENQQRLHFKVPQFFFLRINRLNFSRLNSMNVINIF